MKNFRGFTLVELMIVVAIIGILGGIAVPNIISALPKQKLKKAAGEIASSMRKARAKALSGRRDITLEFNRDAGTYVLDGASALPYGCNSLRDCYGASVEFGVPGSSSDPITFTDDKITFNAMGYPKAGNTNKYVYVRNKDNKHPAGYRIGITGLVGSIKMEQCGSAGVVCP